MGCCRFGGEFMQSSQKIAIVGAGIGGLAAGHFLREAGRDVAIYERAPIPGGRIQLLEREGARIDVGTQYFHTNYEETLKLLHALDLEDQLLPIRAPVMLMRNGRGEEMKRVIPNFTEEVEGVEVVRHQTGMSRYRVGIYPRLREFLKGMRRIKGLHLVGDYYGHSTIETVVRSARSATDELLARPTPSESR